VFFADQAVLVEGISDRLVVASLLDAASAFFANNDAIEIIEVGGKGNFAEYRRLLDALDTPSFVITDLDYLKEHGSAPVRSLFRPDGTKAWDAIRQKKGADHRTAIQVLRRAVQERDHDTLLDFLSYVEGRCATLREPLDDGQKAAVDAELRRLLLDRIFVLRQGDIEDYLPPSVADIKSIVELTVDRNWINRLPWPDRRNELGRMICEVLGVEEARRAPFLELAESGRVEFPAPMG
jgi:hypothetical protein